MSYADFLARKAQTAPAYGEDTTADDVHPRLHDWQREIVAWAVRTGRAAIWADTGLGKTLMQVEWARLSGQTSLIVAPLAVCTQTVREAATVDVAATYVRDPAQMTGTGVYVTNYEMVSHFDPDLFDAVVLDEASILKQSDGKTRTRLIAHFADTPRRLACTATPAPNDIEELTNQAEFLGRSTRVNMLAAYFVHDSDTGWRLKGHAHGPMFKWMTSWAVALRRPSDIGYSDDGYDLPGLEILPHLLPVDIVPEDQLFATDLGGVGGRAAIRKQTLVPRCDRAIQIVNQSHGMSDLEDTVTSWDGSPNTRTLGEPSTQPTLPNASAARDSRAGQTRTANTCAPTTKPTRNVSASTAARLPSEETPDAESGTRPIPNTARSASDSVSAEIRNQSETLDFAASSVSPPPSTTTSSRRKVAAAPSAASPNPAASVPDCTSTTATTADGSVGSSALSATSVSASSEMSPISSSERPTTSLEPWVIWCGLNDEQDYLARAFGDRCFSLTGSQSPEEKVDYLYRWLNGERPILLTKTSIAGMGINMQHCARMAFVGLSDSYESYYQAIRRCYRYGQTRIVHAHVVLSDIEGQIASNIARKEREASSITAGLVAEMRAAGELTRERATA